MAFTETHLISFCRVSYLGHLNVVQVFTLPPDGSPVEKGNPVFRLTHEGVLDDFCVIGVEVLKSTVDPVTGATTLSLLDHYAHLHHPRLTRLDLTLPEPFGVDVLPMTIKTQQIGFPKDGAPETCYQFCFQYAEVSDDGQVRGFLRRIPQQVFPETVIGHIMKFTVDSTQDPWVTTCGKLSPAKWNHIEGVVENIMTFDGMRGKVCVADPRNYKTIVVVDIE